MLEDCIAMRYMVRYRVKAAKEDQESDVLTPQEEVSEYGGDTLSHRISAHSVGNNKTVGAWVVTLDR